MKILNFPLTIISVIGLSILIPFSLISYILQTFVILFLALPVSVVCFRYLNLFKFLEIVRRKKRSKPNLTFLIGLYISGYSIFFILLKDILGDWNWFLNSIFITIGGFLMEQSWKQLPSLKELEWINKMDRLIVIHLNTSNVLFKFSFMHLKKKEASIPNLDLTGAVITGVDRLFQEILANNDHIKKIDHGKKKIFFAHGTHVSSVLISLGESEELMYRVETFNLSFEKQFKSILKDWKGYLAPFQKSRELVRKIFNH
ncbi:MAG: hypothetical protein V3V33_01680 [Candidatus Lokiarchaeia archaeon]